MADDDQTKLDHHGALEHLRRFAREHGLDPRIDLADVVMETFRSAHGRTGRAGDRVSASELEKRAAIIWSHVDDVNSDVPCPWWCTLRPGHAYQEDDGVGNLIRSHSRRFGSVGAGCVEVTQLETALSASGPASLGFAVAHIWAAGDGSEALDAATCFELGSALREASLTLARLQTEPTIQA